MKSTLKTAIFIIITTALTACGLPRAFAANSTNLITRVSNEGMPLVGVYYCAGPNWTGACTHATFELQSCFTLPAGVMSIGTDYGAGCMLYSKADCGLDEPADYFVITYPGCANVPAANPPVSAWSGALDCLAMSNEAEDLCVLTHGNG